MANPKKCSFVFVEVYVYFCEEPTISSLYIFTTILANGIDCAPAPHLVMPFTSYTEDNKICMNLVTKNVLIQ